MKRVERANDPKMPRIKIKDSLAQYKGKVIFKTTFLKAQETLKNVNLPQISEKKSESV